MTVKLLGGVAAIAMLAGISNASADVIFDGSSWSATTNGTAISQTTNGTTTITAPSTGGVGSDYVNLSTPITSNSGIWTLSATVNANPTSFNDNFSLGFGTFTNTQSALTNTNLVSEGPSPNAATGPWIFGGASAASERSSAGMAVQFSHGATAAAGTINGSLFNTTGTLPLSSITFQIVLNTNTPNWTLQFFQNGVPVSFATTPNQATGTVDELVYAINPQDITQFGISVGPNDAGASVTFSNISLTDTQEVQAVPEPSTWAMMFIGFAGLGFVSYRRSQRKGGLNFRFA
jgi:hypothetical protein